jgi:hypothetical protein
MPQYTPFVFCNECGIPHAAPIQINLAEQIAPEQSIANVYDGRELPPQLLNLTNNMFQCPNTRKMYVQKDNNQVFLVRTDGGLPPWLRK